MTTIADVQVQIETSDCVSAGNTAAAAAAAAGSGYDVRRALKLAVTDWLLYLYSKVSSLQQQLPWPAVIVMPSSKLFQPSLLTDSRGAPAVNSLVALVMTLPGPLPLVMTSRRPVVLSG